MLENDKQYLSRFLVADDGLTDDLFAYEFEEGEGFETYTEEDETDDMDEEADWN